MPVPATVSQSVAKLIALIKRATLPLSSAQPRRRGPRVGMMLALAWVVASVPAKGQVQIENLGTFGYGDSWATGVSDNGTVVIGRVQGASRLLAFRWTPTTGMESLGSLGDFEYYPVSISGDGSTVVGLTSGTNTWGNWIWRQETGMTRFVPGFYPDVVNVDGTSVLGRFPNYPPHLVRTADGFAKDLGNYQGRPVYAWGMDPTGSLVVGMTEFSDPTSRRPVRWTEDTGWSELGLPTGWGGSFAVSASFGGARILGSATNPEGFQRAVVWGSTQGMIDIGNPPGIPTSNCRVIGNTISSDGRTVLGVYMLLDDPQGNFHWFIWTEHLGIQDLVPYLRIQGMQPRGVDPSRF